MFCDATDVDAHPSGSEKHIEATTVLAVVFALPHVEARQRRRSLSGHAEARQSGNSGCGSTSRRHNEISRRGGGRCNKSLADAKGSRSAKPIVGEIIHAHKRAASIQSSIPICTMLTIFLNHMRSAIAPSNASGSDAGATIAVGGL